MSLRRQRPPDSLDLLLDTMCNTFGGIILLAVLLTLMTSRDQAGQVTKATDSREKGERRTAMARAELNEAIRLSANLRARTNRADLKDRLGLVWARREIQEELRRLRGQIARLQTRIEVDGGGDLAREREELDRSLTAARGERARAQVEVATLAADRQRLEDRRRNLARQASTAGEDSRRSLRLPKERETDKREAYIIARYGRLYFCRNGDVGRNENDIAWTELGGKVWAQPIRGKGVDPATNPGAMDAFLNGKNSGSAYVVFLTYEDSFPAFILARKLVAERGFSYGWEPFPGDRELTFGEEGYRPKPQ